ncbi:hypothetical protein FXB39_06150 [Nocardioides sp. BGMRC 2183]|nr:hypothetical protein FXB39_06150 [Nocardioides sp. BGMRC 2183]
MNRLRRALAGTAAGAVAASGVAVLGVASAPAAHAEEVSITDAVFTWGLSGYAQKGIFGPWNFKDLSGNATQLVGTVSGGSQTEYTVDPVPATSMPTAPAGATPNAVKLTDGTGTKDTETGAIDIAWTGSYTVNAYPAQFGAPDEIYSDPALVLDGEGNGELTVDFTIGAGQDMDGNPTDPVDLGRVPVMTFSEGSIDTTSLDSFRLTPDYQGVEVSPDTLEDASGAQSRNCTTDGGATGWWGSWPAEFVEVVPSFVRPHFYSTGCSGMQDNKPALPADVDLGLVDEPEVEVSATKLLPSGEQQITVTGTGFDPAAATAGRPPLMGKPAGVYIAFGKFAEVWQPSADAASSTRVNSDVDWAVMAEDMATIGGPDAGAIELTPEGTFEASLIVDKAAIDAKVAEHEDPASLIDYGVYTYAGGGAKAAPYETYTPVTFAKKKATANVKVAKRPTTKKPGRLVVNVTKGATGKVAVVVKKGKKKVLNRVATLNRKGAVALTLPKRGAGKFRVNVVYRGDVNHTVARDSAGYKVTKPKKNKKRR